MFSVIFIVAIAIFASASTFISSAGKIIDRRRKGFKYITNKGWATISLNLAIIIISIVQFSVNEKALKNNEKESNLKQISRDSILKSQYDSALLEIKRKFDTSNTITVSTVSETLGKYGYLLDSSNKVLVKIIKDSSKTKIIESEDPALELCSTDGIRETEHKDGKYFYALAFCSSGGNSSSINLKFIVATTDSLKSKQLTYIVSDYALAENSSLSKNNVIDAYFFFPESVPYGLVYVLVKGTYKNYDKTKTYEINTVYYYNPKTRRLGIMKGQTETNIRNFLKNF